jgi:hypothetical protein
MTTEGTNQNGKHEEKCAGMDHCSPQTFAEMMAKCGDDMKCMCGPMMQEMMKRGCCQPEKEGTSSTD